MLRRQLTTNAATRLGVEREKREAKQAAQAEDRNRRAIAKAKGLVYTDKKSFLRDIAWVEHEAKARAEAEARGVQPVKNVDSKVQDAEMPDAMETLEAEKSAVKMPDSDVPDSEMIDGVGETADKKLIKPTNAEVHRVTAWQKDIHFRTGELWYGRNQH